MKRFSIIIIVSAGLLLLPSCHKDEKPEKAPSGPCITFAWPQTKALIRGNSDLLVNGSKIKVYDYLSNVPSTVKIDGTTWSDGYYIDGAEIEYDAVSFDPIVWKYVNNDVYPWTPGGIHTFFAYLALDYKGEGGAVHNNPAEFFGSEPSLHKTGTHAGQIEIPAKTITVSDRQFDFLYAGGVTREPLVEGHSTVNLPLNHLFTAVSLTVENLSDGAVNITSVSIPNLPNRAETTYLDGLNGGVAYGARSVGSSPFFPSRNIGTFASGAKYDLLAGTSITNLGDAVYRIAWPLNTTHLHPVNTMTPAEEAEEGRLHSAADSLIQVTWIFNDTELSTRLAFPEGMGWEAGKLNKINLQFVNKMVRLNCQVLPWDLNEFPMDFSEQSLTVTSKLALSGYGSKSGNTYYVSGLNPITATFQVLNPVGGNVIVSMSGDTQWFEIHKDGVAQNTFTINPSVDEGRISFEIQPLELDHQGRARSIQLHFYVELPNEDVRVINGDSEIVGPNPSDNPTITLPL
ncbi:MAG: fimbrillin family protein [Bacteroidales bacterium]|nr:fimbrillin family protein [Bacteroidales bacterium]